MSERILAIPFSTGGINRRVGYQWQKPYFTVDALNVVPADPLLGRDRGGLRAGMTKYHADDWGSRFRCLGIFTNVDGTRSLIGATLSGGVSYAPISGESPSNGGGLNTTGRMQCFQFNLGMVFVGDTVHPTPVVATYATTGGVNNIADIVFTDDPSVDFPTAYPVCGMAKYNRLFLAFKGDTTGIAGRPNRWWASAVNDPLNMDDAADEEDPTTAYSAELNDTNDQITAMIPWFGNYSAFATTNQFYVLDGDPRAGGTMRQCSKELGIVDCGSWCIGEDDAIVAMSASGPIIIPPGATPRPELLLRDSLPGVLSSPDTANYEHTMAYDSRSRRVWIFRTSISGVADVDHYMLDLQEKGWWRFRFASTNHEPFAAIPLRELASNRTNLLLGCRDGYLRYFDEAVGTDDGTNIANYVWLGPFKGGNGFDVGIWQELIVSLAKDSGDVTVAVHRGNSAEEAYNSTAQWSRTFSAGTSPIRHPIVSGDTFYLKVTGAAGVRWAWESARGLIAPGGRMRT